MLNPHAPLHFKHGPGVYMITAGTYKKLYHLDTPSRRDLMQRHLFDVLEAAKWDVHAWAILSNHYHVIVSIMQDSDVISKTISKLHMFVARDLNVLDRTPGRRVWYQYWDSLITYSASYWTRLRYVEFNPVRHGMAEDACAYRWCSAAWYRKHNKRAQVLMVESMKIDQLRVVEP